MTYAEQMQKDYTDVLKAAVVPIVTKQFGIKIREIRVLVCAHQLGNRVAGTDIANALRQDPATITRSLITLVGLKFVETTDNYEDGRSRLILLTDKGNQAVACFNKAFDEAISKAESALDLRLTHGEFTAVREQFQKHSRRVARSSQILKKMPRRQKF